MIHVVGIGPGDPSLQLNIVKELADKADYIYGSQRQLESISDKYESKKIVFRKDLDHLVEEIKEKIDDHDLIYLASGDPMIYGIGEYFIKKLGMDRVSLYPGISSTQYIFSKIGISMNDCFITSSHGRDPDFDLISKLPKTVMVTDKKIGPYQIAQELISRGLERTRIFVGQRLSYEDEQIDEYYPHQVEDKEYKMCVVVLINEG